MRVPLYLVIMRGHYFVEVLMAGGSQLYWDRLFIVLLKAKFMVWFCLLLFLFAWFELWVLFGMGDAAVLILIP